MVVCVCYIPTPNWGWQFDACCCACCYTCLFMQRATTHAYFMHMVPHATTHAYVCRMLRMLLRMCLRLVLRMLLCSFQRTRKQQATPAHATCMQEAMCGEHAQHATCRGAPHRHALRQGILLVWKLSCGKRSPHHSQHTPNKHGDNRHEVWRREILEHISNIMLWIQTSFRLSPLQPHVSLQDSIGQYAGVFQFHAWIH